VVTGGVFSLLILLVWRLSSPIEAGILLITLSDFPGPLLCNVNRVPEPTATPPSLGETVLWIAKLGGFLARKNDGDPGPQVLWRGFQHLPYITDMFLIMRQNE
jgi:hypothetical protein